MDSILKAVAKPLIQAAFRWIRDPDNQEEIFQWLEEAADKTETNWDDVAVNGVKALWGPIVDMADGFLDNWSK
jgi:hypothetical protein